MTKKDEFPEFEPEHQEIEKRQKQQEENEKEMKQNQKLHDNRRDQVIKNQQEEYQSEGGTNDWGEVNNEKDLNNQSKENQNEQNLNDLTNDIANKQGRNFN